MIHDFKTGFLQKFDWLLALPAFLLSMIGLIAIYSSDLASLDIGFSNFKKQLIAFSLGLLIMFIVAVLNFRQLKNAKIFYTCLLARF